MGTLGRELDRLGGKVRGVKPRRFLKFEPTHNVPEVGDNEIVPDVHSQKVRMAQLSDAFLFLHGGFGTFEELGTYRMWGKLGECLSCRCQVIIRCCSCQACINCPSSSSTLTIIMVSCCDGSMSLSRKGSEV